MGRLLRRFARLLRQRRFEAEIQEEMEFHRALKQRELEGTGLAAEEAAAAARREMGNATLAREESRAVWLAPWIESVWQDLAYAARNLRRQPGFTVTALLALVLAIGANTSLFTVFNAIALRPWPVPEPNRVVTVHRIVSGSRSGTAGFPVAEYRFLGENVKSFRGLVATRSDAVHLENAPLGKRTMCQFVSANYFDVLGVPMELGRGFRADEDLPEQPLAVAVLGYPAWQARFAGDPAVVGKQIRIDEVPFTVVGVAPRDFIAMGTEGRDLWVPLASMKLVRPRAEWVQGFLTSPNDCCASVAGRLAPGATRDQARAELDVVSARFRAQHKLEASRIVLAGTAFLSSPGAKRKVGTMFVLMFVAVTLVLLLTCANVGNLLLARAAARQREVAVRLSIGASRTRVVRQFLTEGLLLAGAAGAAGVVVALWLPRYVLGAAFDDVPNFHFTPDLTVLAYTLGVCVLSCLVFALAPALRVTRCPVSRALKQDFAAGRVRLRSVLLAAQVSISVVLLAGAALMVRGVRSAATQDPGFAVADVAAVAFDLPAGDSDRARARAFVSALESELPNAALTRLVPLGNSRMMTGFRLPGEPKGQWKPVLAHAVSAAYFDMLRIPIVAGRNFAPGDLGRKALLVNQAMARQWWPDGSALGKTVIAGGDEAREIVGIVRDARTTDLDKVEPTMYFPFEGDSFPIVLVRTGETSRLTAVVGRLEPKATIRVTPLSENLERYLAPSRVGATLAGALGTLALALAAIGTAGVFGYHVRQRTKEIGIRMALGAQSSQVVRLVLSSESRALAVGLALGLAASVALSSLIENQLFGVSRLDPLAYGTVALLLLAAGLAAGYFPVRRAAGVDPMAALRYE